ncbi:Lrp/AsnC family transcriptional regulator [Sciscionella sediminilitoris]|uniref:Lrp/AsnC family transcriptional regulator n=1 Tax=Sciscionella sediminilitoris TaxID=1445613 RepID=UPI0004DF7B60|nr:Lrp/AsnC family transcriptional regulator [Sciscionella sp. SE31]
MDATDRKLIALLLEDARLTYQELAKSVRMSANTVADRVRRLRAAGIISGYHAKLDHTRLGRPLVLVSDLRLREGYDNERFHESVTSIPQIFEAFRTTGEYDYQIRVACTGTADFEQVIATLKRDHGVREVRSRLLLREIPMPAARLLES